MRSGDIDTTYRSARRMQEGIQAHQRIQKAYGKGYRAEVTFRDETELEGMVFEVEGRADGVYEGEDGPLIDEIKSTTRDLDEIDPEANALHWAQAKCYAHFYAKQNDRASMSVQLTYVNLDEEVRVRKAIHEFSAEELRDFYEDLLKRYLVFSRAIVEWRKKRDASIETVEFPYAGWRPGQRRMAVGIYLTIEDGGTLFIDAPTGIGKTISALIPSIRSVTSLGTEVIFYATARTTTQREPQKALALLRERGLRLKSVVLSAKEKICLNDRVSCNPIDCPYAKGHFDRVNDAILDLYGAENALDPEIVRRYAEKHAVCPFELQLDMSDYSDFIIGDYNYVYDPRVYLRRAFDESGRSTVVLVDEAHNLVDRGREMFSAELLRSDLEAVYRKFKKEKAKKILSRLGKLLKEFDRAGFDSDPDDEDARIPERASSERPPEELYYACKGVMGAWDTYLNDRRDDKDYELVLDVHFKLLHFTRIFETWIDGFVVMRQSDGDISVSIRCIDPTELFGAMASRVRASIFFSATLTPMSYYSELLGGGETARHMHLASPFPPENLGLFTVAGLSTRYADRKNTLSRLVDCLRVFLSSRPGNYMVFFPSYAYLHDAEELYEERYGAPDIVQSPGMSDDERRAALERFTEDSAVTGFFVLGGVFSEGVDLLGERLIGTAIVSVGMPGLSFERDLIRSYFDQKAGCGFDYAYTFPGMNKVLQGAGRVIRSETDRGAVLLLDDRYLSARYRALFPTHWQTPACVRGPEDLEEALRLFWNR